MSLNLAPYSSIRSSLAVRLVVDEYRTSPGGSVSTEVIRFSDSNVPITLVINGSSETFAAAGNLVDITPSRSELKANGTQVTISISGINNNRIAEVMNSNIKGCRISVYRVIYNAETGQPLVIDGNPAGRFFGLVTNYTIDEVYDINNRTSSSIVSLVCSSQIDLLKNKTVGRRTNPTDEKYWYPTDTSMDRVPNLTGSNYNFGEAP